MEYVIGFICGASVGAALGIGLTSMVVMGKAADTPPKEYEETEVQKNGYDKSDSGSSAEPRDHAEPARLRRGD